MTEYQARREALAEWHPITENAEPSPCDHCSEPVQYYHALAATPQRPKMELCGRCYSKISARERLERELQDLEDETARITEAGIIDSQALYRSTVIAASRLIDLESRLPSPARPDLAKRINAVHEALGIRDLFFHELDARAELAKMNIDWQEVRDGIRQLAETASDRAHQITA